ncbi:exodeoxyribonuclease III [Pelomicrobium methylotrophicum]|uniref:Exodeoxyribonuclease III n=1 Tax=Pelomicrobium methylotrophicum TaxID=2602750 RepID=A0A5C7EWF7_9PROT|nr:exodeoxyribonuclease III [Pelomicrobium methylotrophicum]TXF12674.1 exodeoxyribonuclease III [Pelomicrobium methylotrophicum]
MLRIITLNLNGIRSAAAKGFFEWMPRQRAQVVCVQELKALAADLTAEMMRPDRMQGYFHFSQRRGYSGVGIYCKQAPERIVEGLGIADIDAEGRYLEARYDGLSIVSLYVPSGSAGPERQAVKFSFMERFFPVLKKLAGSGRECIVCGDINIAHKEIDLKNWRSNQKNSGFLPEERAWLTRVFDELGFVDVYRRLYPDATGEAYTWWSNRGRAWEKNVGWRIDYQIATPKLAQLARRAFVYKERRFSDHAPLIVDYDVDLPAAPKSRAP